MPSTPRLEVRSSAGLSEDDVRRVVREEMDAMRRRDPVQRRMAIIASKGTLDWAYPPLILASAGAAMGMEVSIFFTFYGLNIITRDFEQRLKVAPAGNPAMPMPVPLPQFMMSMPGMMPAATSMMKGMFSNKGVASVGELLGVCQESGVRLVACRMTMEVFGYREEDFRDGVEFGGAAAFLSTARKGTVTLFV